MHTKTTVSLATLQNKRILLGVTGGIAAYKSAEIVRRLQDLGADVRVAMTPAAQEFITPLTLQALSGNHVHTDLLDPEAEAAMGHIELSRWADLILIAPASADFLSKLCHGVGSDLLSTLCLASSDNIAVAPAMNQGMWASKATQENLRVLSERGVKILGPASGIQACGDVGLGRMLEPDDIALACASYFEVGTLAGKTVVITAGPTQEAIDPVRYISNHSSGKMGYALAAACVEAGAKTILISGPVSLAAPDRVDLVKVISADDMYQQAMALAKNADIFIASAAVADYKPARVAEQKIKKGADDSMSITLIKNPDIVASVARLESSPYVVGFAAETNDLEHYARRKLQEKNLNLVVANDVSSSDIGFNSEDNAVTVIHKTIDAKDNLKQTTLPKMSKAALARQLTKIIADNC